MENMMYGLFWTISLLISGAGTWLWVKLLLRVDPTWNAKEHKWGQYIFAGVLSIFVAYIFYFLGFMIWGSFNSVYPAANDFWFYILVNGPAEEWGKFLVFWLLAVGFGKVKEPRDGVLVAMMVALGFSFWENISYILMGGLSSVPVRVLWASSGHMAYAAVWGYFGGQMILEPPEGKGFRKYRYLFSAVFVMSFVHGMFNFLSSWVSGGAAFTLDLVVYVVTLIVLTQVLGVPSAYKQFPVKDASSAIPIINAALKRDPQNKILKRRLGFYYLALGREREAFRAWSTIPRMKRDAYLDSWISVLNARRGLHMGAAYRGRNDDLEKHLTRMSGKALELFKKRLSFYLKGEALRWIRRVCCSSAAVGAPSQAVRYAR